MAEMVSMQQDMCEILGYMQILGYQDRTSYSNKDQRDDAAKKDFPILETIAISLVTGKPGDVVAAAFEKRDGTTELVLAKNGHADDSDRAAAKRLWDAIYGSLTNGAESLWPVIVERCGENITKRIRKLFETLHRLNDLMRYLRFYKPQSTDLNKELPRCGEYLNGRYGGQGPSVTAVINNAWDDIMEHEGGHRHLLSGDMQASFSRYRSLSEASFILYHSRYLTWLHHTNTYNSNAIFKLKRRLTKVYQYYQGLETLLAIRESLPEKRISSFRWVTRQLAPSLPKLSVETEHWRERIIQHYEGNVQISPAAATVFRTHFRKKDCPKFFFTPVFHAEAKLAVSLELERNGPGNSHTAREIRMIGCSKRSCLSCSIWLRTFNDRAQYKWMTGGSHGKPYGNWMIPMIQQTPANTSLPFILQEAAKTLLERLKHRFSQRLNNYAQEPLQSDEFRSETDTSEDGSKKSG